MIEDIIAQNPSTITITRHTKVPLSGGFDWAEADLDPITVRIYLYNTHNQTEVTLPEGEVKKKELGLLASTAVDIVVGHDSYDEFVYQGRKYRIVGVRSYNDSTTEYNLQADCVAV